jgi:YegS/Rv2252/BmrU family lipid kinase
MDPIDVRSDTDGLRSAVVLNPAKVDDLQERREAVLGALAEAGWPEPKWYETTVEDSGFGQARDAVEQGAEVVFVCGGDGTVMACVGALAGTDAALAVLPAGTGNLLAANLGLPDDAAAGVTVATEMGRRRLDVGVVEGRCFVVMAGMGFDADMVASTSETLKARIGVGAYVWSALQRLRDRPMRVAIRLDDDLPLRRRARTVLVGNVGRLQGGVRLLADAEPDNGQMDVAILTPRTLLHWLRLVWGVLRRHDRVPRMEVLRARRIEVISDREQPRQLDGDPITPGRTLAVTVRPGALLLCVPQPERSPDLAEGAP